MLKEAALTDAPGPPAIPLEPSAAVASVPLTELTFTVSADAAEAYAAALVAAGASGVEERDVSTIEHSPPGTSTLVVWVAPGEVTALLTRLEFEVAGLPEAQLVQRQRDEAEWRDTWKQYFVPRPVGRFVLVPSWQSYSAQSDEVILGIDPGRAFGTGGHASTRLCLRLLSSPIERTPIRFLDVGCGSGVLAIGCALLWPTASGLGIDLDSEAVAVSRENAQRNQVAERIHFATTPLSQLTERFDVIAANIEPTVLIDMAQNLEQRLAPGATLVLSGIVVEAADTVEKAYREVGLSLADQLDEEGWRSLVWTQS